MTTAEFLADQAARNLALLEMALADMTDEDMLVRPCPGANHANWQVGHLISSEVKMLSAMPGNPEFPALPEGFHAMYDHDKTGVDSPDAFLTKAELLSNLSEVRKATVAWIRGLTPELMAQEVQTPLGPMAPTVGHMAAIVPTHLTLHTGQIQVIRRKTAKPVLF